MTSTERRARALDAVPVSSAAGLMVGEVPGPERLSKVAVWRMVTAYAERAGLLDDTAPRTLRHTFSSILAATRIPLEVREKLLGHADPHTILLYWKQHDRAGADAIALEHSRLPASRLVNP